jgi:hypothetical protein
VAYYCGFFLNEGGLWAFCYVGYLHGLLQKLWERQGFFLIVQVSGISGSYTHGFNQSMPCISNM